jgi:predicted tellurium resistance membrane protein TerC
VFEILGRSISWRDLILIGGGFFLLYKGTREIHHRIEGDDLPNEPRRANASFVGVIMQIVVLDIVFRWTASSPLSVWPTSSGSWRPRS